MSTFTQVITETFQVVSCYTCGVRFGIDQQLYRRVVTDAKGSVFCPACGKETIWQESVDKRRIKELEKKLQWEMTEVTRQKEKRIKAENSLSATKGVVTKLTKRISVGVCPCCHRTFRQLKAHMANQHPEFVQSHQ